MSAVICNKSRQVWVSRDHFLILWVFQEKQFSFVYFGDFLRHWKFSVFIRNGDSSQLYFSCWCYLQHLYFPNFFLVPSAWNAAQKRSRWLRAPCTCVQKSATFNSFHSNNNNWICHISGWNSCGDSEWIGLVLWQINVWCLQSQIWHLSLLLHSSVRCLVPVQLGNGPSKKEAEKQKPRRLTNWCRPWLWGATAIRCWAENAQ